MSESYDFVIIGSGGGAMAAALFMRTQGKSVLVLEKTGLLGGSTAKSGGVMWIPNNRFMAEAGIPDSAEAANAYLDALLDGQTDAPGASVARRRAYVAEAPKMLEFLIGLGMKFERVPSWPDCYTNLPGASVPGRTVVAQLFDVNQLGEWKSKLRPTFVPVPIRLEEAMQIPWMKKSKDAKKVVPTLIGRILKMLLTGKKLAPTGNALQGQSLAAALGAGVEFRTDARVKSLVMENGRAVGVMVEGEGGDARIDANLGVLINAGGFAHNQRMRDQYIPNTSTAHTITPEGDTGDLIEEAQRCGAAIAQMDCRIGMPVTTPPNHRGMIPGVGGDMAKPHAIMVDQSGARFANESQADVDLARLMLERHKTTPAVPSWIVVDSQYFADYALAGAKPGKKFAAWAEAGFLKQGDSIADLARAAGMAPETLEATVARFNGFVKAGKDEDFLRGESAYDRWRGDPYREGSPVLGALEQGPFYAIPVYPGDSSTFGGIVTDEFARVLKPDGTAIEGLYAAGTSAASLTAGFEAGAGGSIGPAYTFGYIAAKHAANADNAAA